MSIESPITEKDNWFAGEDKVIDYYITTSPRVEASATAAQGATVIAIEPLSEALADGDKVRFTAAGETGIVATLTAAAAVGATSLTVSALGGTIHVGTVGGKVQDITGWALEWVLRDGPAGATALITKTRTETAEAGISITDGANGICRVTIADTDTLTLAPGRSRRYYYTLRRTDEGSEQVLSFGDAILRRAATR